MEGGVILGLHNGLGGVCHCELRFDFNESGRRGRDETTVNSRPAELADQMPGLMAV